MPSSQSMPRPTRAQVELVETRIARGWTVYRIAERLHLPLELVRAVRDEQNRVARETESK